MAKPNLTVLLLLPDKVARLDLGDPTAEPLGFWEQPTLEHDLLARTETAAKLGPVLGRKVWVLDTELWTQSLELPENALEGATKAQTMQTLSFEVEPFSGISSLDSILGYFNMGPDGYWISQVRRSRYEEVEDAVRQAGGNLVGLCHPAGLALKTMAAQSAGEAWSRVELWPNVIVCTYSDEKGDTTFRILNDDPQYGTWEAETDSWFLKFPESEKREYLVGGAFADPNITNPNYTIYNVEEHLRSWLTARARFLMADKLVIPVVRPPSRAMGSSHKVVLLVVFSVVAMMFCLIHSNRLERKIAELTSVISVAPDSGKLTGEINRMTNDVAVTERQKDKWSNVLKHLANNCPDNVVIKNISTSEKHLVVNGVSLEPGLSSEYAEKLATKMGSLGFVVQPPVNTAYGDSGQGPWFFSLMFEEK